MLYTNITTPRVSKEPETQAEPLLLEFDVNFVQNQSEIISRGFSRMLYTNITKLRASEESGAQGGPLVLDFNVSFEQN